LGDAYYNGRGVERDYAEAARWYCKLAERGSTDAEDRLKEMKEKGQI
jgi:TPR repeat protein